MKKGEDRRRLLYKNRYLYAMLLLPLIYFILFKYKPMYGILIAFKDFKVREGILGSAFAGLKYFRQFLEDPDFWNAFKNTIYLSLWQILICFPVPILFALFVNEIRWGKLKGLVQRVCCFPHFVSVVVTVSLMITLVSRDGLVNQIVMAFGVLNPICWIRHGFGHYMLSQISGRKWGGAPSYIWRQFPEWIRNCMRLVKLMEVEG